MKILWMSDSPVSPSGFGNVTRFVCAALATRGHHISILGWQARGSPVRWQNCTIYPMRHDGFGADVLLNYLWRTQPDVLVTLADVWWLTYISHPTIARFMRTAGIPWALYYPIDGDMGAGLLPPSWVRILKTVDLPIAMSRYGRDVSRANGVMPAYIPHGVDTTIFCPPPDKVAAKRALGYEGKFVILSDARNQPRKLLPRTLEIFRRFAANKEDVLLHLHCDPADPAARTPEYWYELPADIEFLGLTPKVRITEGMSMAGGVPLTRLAAIYQAADVHLLSSWGEGFGLPTLQAAAAGVVPFASDYTASRELVLGHGEAIRVQHFVEDQFRLQRAFIDMDDAVNRLEHLYQDGDLLRAKARQARQFAEAYDWQQLIPQWDDLLKQQVPALRSRVGRAAVASQVTVRQTSVAGRHDLAQVLRGAIPSLPDSARVTFNVVESKPGELTAEVIQDALVFDNSLTVPATLPPVDPKLVKARITGCVYISGPCDVPVLHRLSRIFPGLNLWSAMDIDLDPSTADGQRVQAKVVPADTPSYRRHLAASTLALDLAGVNPRLPVQSAELGVPCIGLQRTAEQARLWPELSLEVADEDRAAVLGRWMLTDQGEAAALCARAQEYLARVTAAE